MAVQQTAATKCIGRDSVSLSANSPDSASLMSGHGAGDAAAIYAHVDDLSSDDEVWLQLTCRAPSPPHAAAVQSVATTGGTRVTHGSGAAVVVEATCTRCDVPSTMLPLRFA